MQLVDHTKNIVELKDVSFSYGTGEALSGITFAIHKGDYIGLVGPNGAGKTTLLKIILGLLAPSSGTVTLLGKDIRDFKEWPKIGYVPQKATHFDPNFPATVDEIVMMGRIGKRGLFKRLTALDYDRAKDALVEVGMWDYRDRMIGELSGGQQQRVFIARALAGEPEIIFLDEPTAGVDSQTRTEFYALLRKLNDKGMTLVLVSHEMETLLKEVMHVICVDRTLVCHSSPEEFLKETVAMRIAGKEVNLIEHHHE